MSSNSFHISRRRFLKSSVALTGGLALPAWFLEETTALAAKKAKPLSPNDRPGIALVGCGGRGREIARHAVNFGEMRILCDLDDARLARAKTEYPSAETCKDFRKIISREDIHVVLTATPDHWHTLVNLAALKSGKDVYSEKPLTLTIDEGKRLVAACKKYKRILQTGSQQRSDARFRLACELVRNGTIGKLQHITTGLPNGLRGGPFATAPVPPGLDWDFWLGQAPEVEYVPERCHHSFRYWYEYSGGIMTDWGAHHNDIAQWANGTERSGPVEIDGESLMEMIPGGYTTASQFKVEYTYANGVKLSCKSADPDNVPNGVRFEGTEGWIFVSRATIEASHPELLKAAPPPRKKLTGAHDHMENFFNCIRSRQQPICEAEIGHRSVSVCHLGVISIRLGRRLKWNPDKEEFVGDKEANKFLVREMRKPWNYSAI